MFYKILFFISLSTLLYGGEIVWSSGASQSVSDAEYNKAIREYVAQKYPKELKAWEEEEKKQKKQKRIKELAANSVTLGRLMWQDDEAAKTVQKDWDGAMAYCRSLKLLGFNDWRLPTKAELESIVDISRKPTIKKEFKNVISHNYWSSTTYEYDKDRAWYVCFNGGSVFKYYKGDNYYVRCVRAGE